MAPKDSYRLLTRNIRSNIKTSRKLREVFYCSVSTHNRFPSVVKVIVPRSIVVKTISSPMYVFSLSTVSSDGWPKRFPAPTEITDTCGLTALI